MPDDVNQENELSKSIEKFLDLKKPKSFFLYAGAGTGKTKAVIDAMNMFRQRYGEQFRQSGQKFAVITYTNAACDEIRRRIDFDPIFTVSTLHSFAWEQIRIYHKDISVWLRQHLTSEIEELREKQSSGRAGSKAALEREMQIESKEKRLQYLDTIKQFTYNPNGENIGKNSLNHAEVIAISASFLTDQPLMQRILIRKHPVLIIDESQDTQKDLIDAFFAVQSEHADEFSLSLFGDTMQRIYADGKVGLDQAIPSNWARPALVMNHRCPARIVTLLNQVRTDADGAKQVPRQDAKEGVVRLFLAGDVDDEDKANVEVEVCRMMAQVAGDDEWMNKQAVKVLTLEHHMAARRGGFSGFFEPLYKIAKFKTGLLDGTLSGVAFLAQQVLPLVHAMQSKDRFAVARLVKEYSAVFSPERLKATGTSVEDIRKADSSVQSIFALWDNGADPTILDVVNAIDSEDLFDVPDVFSPIISDLGAQDDQKETESADVDAENPAIEAWREALSVPFSQLHAYVDYISDKSPFGTHQGIKGLQFPRVMVVLDDNEARGFMFSYDKLLGAKPPSSTDQKNEQAGKETSIDRTRRLFYVTCSRAQNSLAVVVYTNEREKVVEHLKTTQWFNEAEIIVLDAPSAIGSGTNSLEGTKQ